MSQLRYEKVHCNECGHVFKVQIWSSINATLDPDLERQLLDGSLIRASCAKCGSEHKYIYDTLYHDMNRNFMVEYSGDDEESSADEPVQDKEMQNALQKYRYLRRVYSWNHLREKVVIYRDGLNDIVVELVKAMIMLHELDMKQPEDNLLWYLGTKVSSNKKLLIFEILNAGRPPTDIGVPIDLYEHYAAKYGISASQYRVGTFSVVNQGEILNILNELREAD